MRFVTDEESKKEYKKYAPSGETAGWTCGNFCAFICGR